MAAKSNQSTKALNKLKNFKNVTQSYYDIYSLNKNGDKILSKILYLKVV